MMMVIMVVVRRANILHLVDRAALRAALDGAFAGGGEPESHVAVSRAASAAKVLLVAEALDDDGVVQGA